MTKEILLIYPPHNIIDNRALMIPLGLAYIASVLLKEGIGVDIIDMQLPMMNSNYLKEIIEREQPKIVGISTTTEQYYNAIKVAGICKTIKPDVRIVMGGPHATLVAEDVIKNQEVDIIVKGEREYTMLEIAKFFTKK